MHPAQLMALRDELEKISEGLPAWMALAGTVSAAGLGYGLYKELPKLKKEIGSVSKVHPAEKFHRDAMFFLKSPEELKSYYASPQYRDYVDYVKSKNTK